MWIGWKDMAYCEFPIGTRIHIWVIPCLRNPKLQSISQNFFIFGGNVVFDGLEEYAKPFFCYKKLFELWRKIDFWPISTFKSQQLDLTPYLPLDITDFRGKRLIMFRKDETTLPNVEKPNFSFLSILVILTSKKSLKLIFLVVAEFLELGLVLIYQIDPPLEPHNGF